MSCHTHRPCSACAARDFHGCQLQCATFMDAQERGPAWVQLTRDASDARDGRLSDLDDLRLLRHSALRIADASFRTFLDSRPECINLHIVVIHEYAYARNARLSDACRQLAVITPVCMWPPVLPFGHHQYSLIDRQCSLALQIRCS